MHNAELLNVSLSDLQGVILSHGHFDHTGGVQQLLSQAGPLPVYGHPELFRERFWVGKFEQRPNGIPFSRDQLENSAPALISPESLEKFHRDSG